ncbi:MAG TPA: hypothetical protein VGD88_00460, partial [Opitutaceae bacterium]
MKDLEERKKQRRAVRWDGTPVLVAVVAFCAFFYFWTAMRLPGGAFSPQPIGYYGLLTSGFRSGHLHVPIEPHPALLALPNPYDPVANAPYRVHDMSLWQGKYYLYFGPTPVLIWFWPVVALTGYYPSEALAIAVFLSLGLVVAARLIAGVRKQFYPSAPAWLVPLGVLVMGLGSPTSVLAQAAEFYHVPIAVAYALNLVMVWALFRAQISDHRAAFWLAAASLAYGLAVGARPNYVFTGIAVVLVWVAVISRKTGSSQVPAWRFRLAATFAAAFPAAICGGSLMLYNWLRFGSVSEFGIHYQLAGSDQQAYQPFVFDNLLPSAAVYLWGPGNWTPYFPFFAPAGGAIPGLFRYLPWAWLALGALLAIGQPAAAHVRGHRTLFAWSLLAVALTNLVVLCVFSGINERYASDIHPSWLLLGGVGALAVMSSQWPVRRSLQWLVSSIGVYTILAGVATFYTRLTPRQGEETWARAMNWPTHLWEQAVGIERGALWMDVELPINRPLDRLDPLFETGRTGDQRDWLHLEYTAEDRARVGFFHAGLGVLTSDEFAIPVDRRLVVEVQCGSLLPPFAHPAFSGLSRRDYDALRRNLSVKVNGVEVLRTFLDCYEASPNDLRLGGRGWLGDGVGETFSGKILSARRLPLNVAALPERVLAERTPIDLEIQFPWGRTGAVEPLLASGEAFSGDLLYVSYEEDNHIRFGFDHYGSGGPRSLAYRYDPKNFHRLVVWFGSWAEPES